MQREGYHIFETPLGFCGIAWKVTASAGHRAMVTFVHLPEATRELAQQKMLGLTRGSGASLPPPGIVEVIKKIQRHLCGDLQEFQEIPVDLKGMTPFARQVYQVARKIPAGLTMTYGELAKAMKRPAAARAVGQALGRNPIPLVIPCHRVLAAGGKVGGFSAPGGAGTKARLLAIEGVVVGGSASMGQKVAGVRR